MFKKQEPSTRPKAEVSRVQNIDDFWKEYEQKTGEKVLAKTLCQYLSGWKEFETGVDIPLWGLAIVTSGGFRFHHYPQQNWLYSLFRGGSSGQNTKEKTIFIPAEQIIDAQLQIETKWWKKILSRPLPILEIKYCSNDSREQKLLMQVEHTTGGIIESLSLHF